MLENQAVLDHSATQKPCLNDYHDAGMIIGSSLLATHVSFSSQQVAPNLLNHHSKPGNNEHHCQLTQTGTWAACSAGWSMEAAVAPG